MPRTCLIVLGLAMLAQQAAAQTYPNRALRAVVPLVALQIPSRGW
jgi:tripartite-type tricarboxylate transporter receptor subunit TctC